MSTFKVGDGWVTFNGLTMGTSSGKLSSKQDAYERKSGKSGKVTKKASK